MKPDVMVTSVTGTDRMFSGLADKLEVSGRSDGVSEPHRMSVGNDSNIHGGPETPCTSLSQDTEQIVGVLSGFDRVVFRGTLRSIAYADGLKRYLRAALPHNLRLPQKSGGCLKSWCPNLMMPLVVEPSSRGRDLGRAEPAMPFGDRLSKLAPAMEAGKADHVWSLEEIVGLAE